MSTWKCEIEHSEIKYLGLIVSEGQIHMDPIKMKAIAEWPKPKKLKELQQFLGFCNFYRRFIRGYSGVSQTLTYLTGKVQWKWDSIQQLAFNELKWWVASEPVLAITNWWCPYCLETDASDYALRAVLSQKQDNKWHPVTFSPKSLNEVEQTTEYMTKKCLLLWSPWRNGVTIYRSKTPIQNLDQPPKPYILQETSKDELSPSSMDYQIKEYNFTLHYKPGKTNIKADLLSRRSDHKRGENDNKDITMLKPEWLRCMEISVEGQDKIFVEQIRWTWWRKRW